MSGINIGVRYFYLGTFMMAENNLVALHRKIERQRKTVETLKRRGQECADAERQLHHLLAELIATDVRMD